MIYEFTKRRSTAVAEIEPQLIDIIEKEIISKPSIAVAEIEPQSVDIIEKEFTKKPSTAVMDIKPKLIDMIHANENYVESELHNDVLVVHQKENLLALETIFNKQESFKNWVISTRLEEIAALEKDYRASIVNKFEFEVTLKYWQDRLKSIETELAIERARGGFDTGMTQSIASLKDKVKPLLKQQFDYKVAHSRYKEMLNELKANTSKIILFNANNVLDPLIIDFIQKHDDSFLAWRNTNENAWLKINGAWYGIFR